MLYYSSIRSRHGKRYSKYVIAGITTLLSFLQQFQLKNSDIFSGYTIWQNKSMTFIKFYLTPRNSSEVEYFGTKENSIQQNHLYPKEHLDRGDLMSYIF